MTRQRDIPRREIQGKLHDVRLELAKAIEDYIHSPIYNDDTSDITIALEAARLWQGLLEEPYDDLLIYRLKQMGRL